MSATTQEATGHRAHVRNALMTGGPPSQGPNCSSLVGVLDAGSQKRDYPLALQMVWKALVRADRTANGMTPDELIFGH
jgi:hypothetical protein